MKPIAPTQNPTLQEIRNLPEAKKELQRLREVTRDVEAMFLKILVSELRKDTGTWIFQKTLQAEIYSDFLSEAVAIQVARRGTGLADLLYQQLEPAILKRISAEMALKQRDGNLKTQTPPPTKTVEQK